MLGLVWLTSQARVNNSHGDNVLYLTTSQCLLDHGTVYLDPYVDDKGLEGVTHGAFWTTIDYEKRVYNYFPIGTSLFSLPVVAVSNALGYDMTVKEDSRKVQLFISGILIALVFLVFYRIARLYFGDINALALAFFAVVGSSLASSNGTGLWSHNFTVLFISLALYQLLKIEKGLGNKYGYWLLGACLFCAYLCRPAAVSFIAATFAYLTLAHTRNLYKVLLPVFAGMGGFILWSYQEFGTPLPAYYLPKRLGETGNFTEALFGHLFSPSRGLLIYSPLFILGYIALIFRKNRQFLLSWYLLGTCLLHLLLISRFIHWWGGWSYGSRLQVDIVPLIFVLVLLTLSAFREWRPRPIVAQGMLAFILLGGAWGGFVHVRQGMLNPRVMEWNGNIDQYPEHYLFNWDFPQFLAGYYPDNISISNANFIEEVRAYQKGLEAQEGDLFLPNLEVFPHFERLTKLHNRKGTFGDFQIKLKHEELTPKERPTYTNPGGNIVLSTKPGFTTELIGEPLRLGDLLHSPEYGMTFIVGNGVHPDMLSAYSREKLKAQYAEFASQDATVGWIYFSDNGTLKLEHVVLEDKVEFIYPPEHLVKVWADANKAPGFCCQIDGQEVADNKMGFNVVQYNFVENTQRDFHFARDGGDVESATKYRVVGE